MSLFFELLQLSVGTRDRMTRVPNDTQWEALFSEANRQAVTGVLLDGLERLVDEQRPPLELFLRWIGTVQNIEAKSIIQDNCTKDLVAKVSTAGFENYVLKGVAVARYYPHPLRRQSCDVDLWTKGCRKDIMVWLLSKWEVGHILWHTVNVNFYENVPVEIHFHPAWLYNPVHNLRLQRWFDYDIWNLHKDWSVGGANRDDRLRFMPVEFDVVYSLVHSFRHFLSEGLNMRQVCDYYYILRRCHLEKVDLTKSTVFIKSIGLSRFAAAIMYVLCEAFGMPEKMLLCTPNEKAGRFLLNEIVASCNCTLGVSCIDRIKRFNVLLRYYASEVLWMFPWKVWHWFWRMTNK